MGNLRIIVGVVSDVLAPIRQSLAASHPTLQFMEVGVQYSP